MAVLVSSAVSQKLSPVACGHGGLLAVRGVLALAAALAANDILDMVELPANHVPVDVVVDTDDLDSGGSPAITFDVGIITGTPGSSSSRTAGNQFVASSTTPQTGGIIRTTKALGVRVASAPVNRSVGIKVVDAPATAVTGSLSGLLNRGGWQPNTAYAADDYITLPNGIVMKCTTAGTSGIYQNGNDEVTQYGPVWALAKSSTTTDGTVTWTCWSPIVALTLFVRPAYKGL